jgi:hypothetical protein
VSAVVAAGLPAGPDCRANNSAAGSPPARRLGRRRRAAWGADGEKKGPENNRAFERAGEAAPAQRKHGSQLAGEIGTPPPLPPPLVVVEVVVVLTGSAAVGSVVVEATTAVTTLCG